MSNDKLMAHFYDVQINRNVDYHTHTIRVYSSEKVTFMQRCLLSFATLPFGVYTRVLVFHKDQF